MSYLYVYRMQKRLSRDLQIVQSHGVATDSYMTLFRYSYAELRLHRVNTSVLEQNTQSIHVMEKVGCKYEGLQLEAIYTSGKYHNVVTMGVLADDYWKPETMCNIIVLKPYNDRYFYER